MNTPGRHAATFVPAVVLLFAMALPGCASTANAPSTGAASSTPAAAPATAQAASDGRVLGADDAPVTIIEFTDLQCPYCARFVRNTWPELRARYIDTGKVRFASRDFPLPFHPFALPAAVASRCAEQQGKYWEFREAVFQRQADLAREPYADIAAALGLDRVRLDACRKDPATVQRVEADVALGQANGIDGTPSFVIGRWAGGRFEAEIVSGAQPIEALATRIDALLQQQQPTQH